MNILADAASLSSRDVTTRRASDVLPLSTRRPPSFIINNIKNNSNAAVLKPHATLIDPSPNTFRTSVLGSRCWGLHSRV